MIIRLFKKDVKDITKVTKYMCLVSLFFACLTRLCKLADHIQIFNILVLIFSNTTYALLINVFINATLGILRIFIISFYKDPSYLTHTLPVTKTELLTSKYLASFSVIISSILVAVLSLFVIFVSKDLFSTLKTFFSASIPGFSISVALFGILLVLLIILQLFSYNAMAFTAIIKGNQSNRKKAGKSVIWFAIFYFVSMIFVFLCAIIALSIGGKVGELFGEVISGNALLTIVISTLIANAILTTLFIFISLKEFNKGVNVD